jgi:hypothetical protein
MVGNIVIYQWLRLASVTEKCVHRTNVYTCRLVSINNFISATFIFCDFVKGVRFLQITGYYNTGRCHIITVFQTSAPKLLSFLAIRI